MGSSKGSVVGQPLRRDVAVRGDDRQVADRAVQLAGDLAGRGVGGEQTVRVQGQRGHAGHRGARREPRQSVATCCHAPPAAARAARRTTKGNRLPRTSGRVINGPDTTPSEGSTPETKETRSCPVLTPQAPRWPRPPAGPKKLGWRQYSGYAAGDAANNLAFAMASLVPAPLLHERGRAERRRVGTMFLLVRFWDAFADLFAGRAVDAKKPGRLGQVPPVHPVVLAPAAAARAWRSSRRRRSSRT